MTNSRIADLHCDVLSKLLTDPTAKFAGADAGGLDVTRERLASGGVDLQVFAIYVPNERPKTPETALHEAELFGSAVLTAPGMKLIRTAADLEEASRTGATGALLSLEGADSLRGEWWALRLLHRLGVRLLGLTWNPANWACDGAMEPRGGGLTRPGRQLVQECEALGIVLDVSHLSERGFWDLAEAAKRPFFASHSNARSLRNHPRNLTDDQIRALIAVDGIVGITFVPWFLTENEPAKIDDVLRHVEHMCALGGEKHLAFGSDFDGIDRYVSGLEHPGKYPALAEALLARYPEETVRGFLGGNARRFLSANLPQQ
ncbi:dipeptidase [Cohnella lubricantis]|uniref:Membrane dipeptidase n=1 Tax=Cohnella lubricantis TaxID=2163172 RepID=A0A841TD93_9BACL|nr:dipeptidase [Cohnella lubricantis]MBB6677985.1 membrane dipeptidase [Cohnella lubricantis]MBP2120554.1 membrane dipeptidase [Cohnella lubricantis]